MQLLKHLNPNVNLFTADTLRDKIVQKYNKQRAMLKRYLASVDSKISFTTDIWTNTSQMPFMVLTAHFLDKDFNMISILIDFVHFPGSHTGALISDLFKKIIDDFGLKSKIMGYTNKKTQKKTTIFLILHWTMPVIT